MTNSKDFERGRRAGEVEGKTKATLESIAGSIDKLHVTTRDIYTRVNGQDREIEKLKVNQIWFMRIFGLIQIGITSLWALLWSRS